MNIIETEKNPTEDRTHGEALEKFLKRVSRITQLDALSLRDFGKAAKDLMDPPTRKFLDATSSLADALLAHPQSILSLSDAALAPGARIFAISAGVDDYANHMFALTVHTIQLEDSLSPEHLETLRGPAVKANFFPVENPLVRPYISFLPLNS